MTATVDASGRVPSSERGHRDGREGCPDGRGLCRGHPLVPNPASNAAADYYNGNSPSRKKGLPVPGSQVAGGGVVSATGVLVGPVAACGNFEDAWDVVKLGLVPPVEFKHQHYAQNTGTAEVEPALESLH